jgi:hypothetical protein
VDVARDVDLYGLEFDASRRELVLAIESGERPALIRIWLDVDDEGARDVGGVELHGWILSCGIAVTNLPPHVLSARFWALISSAMFQGRITK